MVPGAWRTAASSLIACVSALTASAGWGAAATAAAEDSLVQPLVEVAKHREPVIVHAAQLTEAKQKLAAFAKRTGRRPNVLVFIMDDVGWGDLGAYGGGVAVGAPTPHLDRPARTTRFPPIATSTASTRRRTCWRTMEPRTGSTSITGWATSFPASVSASTST